MRRAATRIVRAEHAAFAAMLRSILLLLGRQHGDDATITTQIKSRFVENKEVDAASIGWKRSTAP